MKNFISQRGFTLMDVMLGLVLIGISMFGVISVSELINSQRRNTLVRNSMTTIQSTMASNLLFQDTCTAAIARPDGAVGAPVLDNAALATPAGMRIGFRIPNIRGAGQPELVTELSQGAAAGGNQLDFYGLRVRALRLRGGQQIVPGRYLTNVEIELGIDDASGSVIGGKAFRRTVLTPLIITTAGGANTAITGCYSANTTANPQDVCRLINGNYNPTTRVCSPLVKPFDCPVGYFPVGVTDGIIECSKLGTELPCPTGTFLVELGIGSQKCRPLPTVATVPSPPPTPAGTCASGGGTLRTGTKYTYNGCTGPFGTNPPGINDTSKSGPLGNNTCIGANLAVGYYCHVLESDSCSGGNMQVRDWVACVAGSTAPSPAPACLSAGADVMGVTNCNTNPAPGSGGSALCTATACCSGQARILCRVNEPCETTCQ
jgi:hypothetical protein